MTMIRSEPKSLELLEQQVDDLIKSFQKLVIENNCLNKQITLLHNEKETLINKNKKATESLKNIIMRIQDELSCQTS